MNKKILTFAETKTEKHKFHQHKNPLSINDVDINEMPVYSRASLGKKGFKK